MEFCIIITDKRRNDNPEALGKIVCYLISQLGRLNPVLKGTAYMQVSGIWGITSTVFESFSFGSCSFLL